MCQQLGPLPASELQWVFALPMKGGFPHPCRWMQKHRFPLRSLSICRTHVPCERVAGPCHSTLRNACTSLTFRAGALVCARPNSLQSRCLYMQVGPVHRISDCQTLSDLANLRCKPSRCCEDWQARIAWQPAVAAHSCRSTAARGPFMSSALHVRTSAEGHATRHTTQCVEVRRRCQA